MPVIDVGTLVVHVAAYLQTQGVGTVGHVVFRHQLPSSPSGVVAVFPAGGVARGGHVLESPRVQCLARDETIDTALARASAVFEILDGAWVRLGSAAGRFTADAKLGGYFRDEHNRPVYSMNFTLTGYRP